MTYQGALLRLLSSGWLGSVGQRYTRHRVWRIAGGRGSGLKLKFPQNLDYLRGHSEIPVQEALARYLKAGDVFYDIGANMGFFSLISSRLVGPGGQVCAFEPVSENADAVRENFGLNQLDRSRLFEVAVGRTSGKAELLLTEWDGGSTLSSSSIRPSEPVSRRTVSVVALDDFIPAEKLPLPNFVKIDVEGVELEVIQGMARTIAEARPILLYEVDDGAKDSFLRRWGELDEQVKQLGYDIIRLADSYPNIDWNVGHSLAIPRPLPNLNQTPRA